MMEASSLDADAELKHQIVHDEEAMYYTVLRFLRHKKDEESGSWKFLVHWKGFDESEASWEPFEILIDDVPAMVKDYVLNLPVSEDRNALLGLMG
jgi:hypothetical protein